ncbi:hypothetical protein K2173_000938 [Erythroxylum novogranatense]|uniref:NAC domain-containing protein n=1 Tax=Erythroxylum novogranatense TaxID=1862640 RepID=A0AAV8TSJ4_9ROSI|nr:hypothetical protein K2173_000938 [Erythroxylum novogranatense]
MRIPGVRFYPTDEELVMYHLKRKVLGKKRSQVIGEIYIYKYAPWDLPDRSLLRTGDLKWYFFCPVQKKYAGSDRVNRCMDLGYWTTSGKDRKVHHNSVVVGRIRSLIFHKGKSPNGERTDWVMHEYKLDGKEWAKKGIAQDMYVLCVIFKKDGLGPKNGAQYGAPFKEEDWDSEEEVELGDRHFSSIGVSTLALATQDNPSTFHVPFNYVPENMSVGQSTSCPLETLPPVHKTMVADTNVNAEASQIVAENDDILEMLDVFFEVSELLAQQPENIGNPVEGVQKDKCIDGNNFDNDLANLAGFGQPESNALPAAFYGDQTFPDSLYLELTDLDVPLNCLSGLNSIGLQRVDSPVEGVQTDYCIDENDVYGDLGDLANLAGFDQLESNAIPGGFPAAFYGDQTFNSPYLELMDFDVPLNSLSGFDSIKQIDNNTKYTNNYIYESENFQHPSNSSDVHISETMSPKTCQSGHQTLL